MHLMRSIITQEAKGKRGGSWSWEEATRKKEQKKKRNASCNDVMCKYDDDDDYCYIIAVMSV